MAETCEQPAAERLVLLTGATGYVGGGLLRVRPGGELVNRQVSPEAEDHLSVDAVLEALDAEAPLREERRTHLLPFTRASEENRSALWKLCQRICSEPASPNGAAMGEAP